VINHKTINKEHFMYELSNWIEIHETRYFTTIFQEEGYNKEDFDDLIGYMYYLSKDKETQLTYPKTIYYIPELIKSVKRVKDNTLFINSIIKN
jgi:hypothetical protein